MALACDLHYASRKHAALGQPEAGGGILPGGPGPRTPPPHIGRERTLEAILTSSDYDADTAERYGWVTRSVADAELDDFVDGAATRLAPLGKVRWQPPRVGPTGRRSRPMPTRERPTSNS
ncbi:enoyl-CoA hydratase-related protein [Streptomyces sviceus]|uniref:enoyl-CoA hydratase-related protein n=1 Tax=Streptomyces sviceus TaxID=285530 RepID=UPI00367C7934